MKKGSLGMLLLSLLRERPSYGYALCERLRERSGGTLTFEDGAIYPLLHDYEQQGLIAGYWEHDAAEAGAGAGVEVEASAEVEAEEAAAKASAPRKGPRRRYYRLTAKGEQALAKSVRDWRAFSGAVGRVIGEAGAGAAGAVSASGPALGGTGGRA